MVRRTDPGYDTDSQHPCSRQPPALCDGARMITQDDGTSRREPALTPRAFCTACESRIVSCLEDLSPAYERLEAAIASPVRRTRPVRVTPGSRVLLGTEEFDLMATMSAVLGGWAARVRRVPGLQLTDPGHPPGSPEAIQDACVNVLAKHRTPLLSLQDGPAFRTFHYPPAAPETAPEGTCRHCLCRITPGLPPGPGLPPRWWLAEQQPGTAAGHEHQPLSTAPQEKRDIIPAHLLDLIGDREIIRQGEGWVTVLDELSGTEAGNEIIDLHWKARRLLGETPAWPESLDGIPCRACESMTLERAAPPSDPSLPANHSRCPACRDEMDEETFHQWAETYAQWARGAGIRECRRCAMGNHGYCCWDQCTCAQSGHPMAA